VDSGEDTDPDGDLDPNDSTDPYDDPDDDVGPEIDQKPSRTQAEPTAAQTTPPTAPDQHDSEPDDNEPDGEPDESEPNGEPDDSEPDSDVTPDSDDLLDSPKLVADPVPPSETVDLIPLRDALLAAARAIDQQIPFKDVPWGKQVLAQFAPKVMPLLSEFKRDAPKWSGYRPVTGSAQ